MKESTKGEYEAPSLTVYGSVEAITAEQNSAGKDVPGGPDTADTWYSVGPG
jgi:hypothetical protein